MPKWIFQKTSGDQQQGMDIDLRNAGSLGRNLKRLWFLKSLLLNKAITGLQFPQILLLNHLNLKLFSWCCSSRLGSTFFVLIFGKITTLLHFVVFFHVASLFSTGVNNEKVGVDNEKALELTNSTVFHKR